MLSGGVNWATKLSFMLDQFTIISRLPAEGLSGFLSGWHDKAFFLYAVFILKEIRFLCISWHYLIQLSNL